MNPASFGILALAVIVLALTAAAILTGVEGRGFRSSIAVGAGGLVAALVLGGVAVLVSIDQFARFGELLSSAG